MIEQFSTDLKVNKFYYEAFKVLIYPHRHHLSTISAVKDFIEIFNSKLETNYELAGDHSTAQFDIKVISEDSVEMDEIFVKVAKQATHAGVCIRIFKEV